MSELAYVDSQSNKARLLESDAALMVTAVVLGISAKARVLFVVYIEFETADVLRIISARTATPHERKANENE